MSDRELRPAYIVEQNGTIQKIEAVVVLPHMFCQSCKQPLLGYPDTLVLMVTGQCYFQSPGITFVKEVIIPGPTLMDMIRRPAPFDTSN